MDFKNHSYELILVLFGITGWQRQYEEVRRWRIKIFHRNIDAILIKSTLGADISN